MRIQASVYQVLSWNEWIGKQMENPSLPFLLSRHEVVRFQKDNDTAIKTAVEGHQQVIKEHFELDEQGKIIQVDKFKEVAGVTCVQTKTWWRKEKLVDSTQTIPDGKEPKLKFGKTMEAYQDAMQQFMATEVEINLRPRTFTKFPITI